MNRKGKKSLQTFRDGNSGCKGTKQGVFMVCLLDTSFFQAGILPSLLTSYPHDVVSIMKQDFSNYPVNENVCAWISEGTMPLKKKVQREMMLEKLIGALNLSLRNSGSSYHLGVHCNVSRREIWAELCFSALGLGQSSEWTGTEYFQKTRSLVPSHQGLSAQMG